MNKKRIFDAVIAAVTKVRRDEGDDAIDGASRFDALGLGSLDRVVLVYEIEETLDIELADDFGHYPDTVDEACEMVLKSTGLADAGG